LDERLFYLRRVSSSFYTAKTHSGALPSSIAALRKDHSITSLERASIPRVSEMTRLTLVVAILGEHEKPTLVFLGSQALRVLRASKV